MKLGPDVDLEQLARGTPMFSGADLAAIINEAAIGATLAGKEFIEQDDLEEARDKVRWGRARKSRAIDEKEKRVTAYHEAGHAVVMYCDPHSRPDAQGDDHPARPGAGCDVHAAGEGPAHSYQRAVARAASCVLRRTDRRGDVLRRRQQRRRQDIRQATDIARAMITEWGMSEKLGFLLYGQDHSRNPWEQPERLYSDETAKLIDEEVRSVVDRTYQETRQLLDSHRAELDALAQALLKHETLNRDEVDKIMRGEPLQKATVSELLEAEKDKKVAPSTPAADREKGKADDGEAPGAMPSPA